MRNKVCKQLRRLAERNTTGKHKSVTRRLYQNYKLLYRNRVLIGENSVEIPSIEEQLNTQG